MLSSLMTIIPPVPLITPHPPGPCTTLRRRLRPQRRSFNIPKHSQAQGSAFGLSDSRPDFRFPL